MQYSTLTHRKHAFYEYKLRNHFSQ
jgi:hypothetical protein